MAAMVARRDIYSFIQNVCNARQKAFSLSGSAWYSSWMSSPAQKIFGTACANNHINTYDWLWWLQINKAHLTL